MDEGHYRSRFNTFGKRGEKIADRIILAVAIFVGLITVHTIMSHFGWV